MLRVFIIAILVGVRVWFKQDWLGSLLLVIGWVIGNLLAEADHLFYVAVCNPQELTCQRVRHEVQNKNWKNAWGILKSTSGERIRLPIHNILTGWVVAVLGLWIVSSGGSVLASGVVVGLGIRLFSDFYFGKKEDWFWIFAREFGKSEINIIGGIWGLLLLFSLIGLVR